MPSSIFITQNFFLFIMMTTTVTILLYTEKIAYNVSVSVLASKTVLRPWIYFKKSTYQKLTNQV